jgi:hypothetical protein
MKCIQEGSLLPRPQFSFRLFINTVVTWCAYRPRFKPCVSWTQAPCSLASIPPSSFVAGFTRTFSNEFCCSCCFNQNWFMCGEKKTHHNVIDWTIVQVEKVVNLWYETMHEKHVVWQQARSLYKCFHTYELRDLWVSVSGHHQASQMSRIYASSKRGPLLKWNLLTGKWQGKGIRFQNWPNLIWKTLRRK